MGNKGSETTTQTTAPDSQAMAAYRALLDRATAVASQPYSPYGGDLTAGINTQQQAGIGNINQFSGWAQPYMQQAAGFAQELGQGPTADDLARYQSPHTQMVVDATQAQFNRANAAQQNDLRGRAAASGALGGNAVPIAAADMAYQQQQGQAPVIAGLYSRGYDQALAAWQQGRGQGATSLANIGVAGQQAGLSGAGAQLGAGTVQQQNEQQRLNALYQQYQMGQAFPYQQTQWLAGLQTGVGSQMGGTGQTTAPGPNPFAQIAGVGLAALSFANRGGRVGGFAAGGDVSPEGGFGVMPYGNVDWLPQIGLTRGRGAPEPPRPPQAKPTDPRQMAGLAKGLQKLRGGFGSTPMDIRYDAAPAAGVGEIMPSFPSAWGGIDGNPIYRRGGGVHGYATDGAVDDEFYDDEPLVPTPVKTISIPGVGASPSFEDRWAPTREAVAVGDFDPQGENNSLAYSPDLRSSPTNLLTPAKGLKFPGVESSDVVPLRSGVASPSDGWIPAPREGSPDARAVMRGETPPSASPPARSGLFGLNIPSDLRLPMLTAGLGMLASRSPHLGTAIGEGGLAGVGTYVGQQKATQDRAFEEKKFKLSESRLDNETKRLDQAAKNALERLQLDTRRVEAVEARTEAENWKLSGRDTDAGDPIGYNTKTGALKNMRTGEALKEGEKIVDTKGGGLLTPDAIKVGGRQLANGDLSPLRNIGKGAQGGADLAKLRNEAVGVLVNEHGMSPDAAAAHMSTQLQRFNAQGIGLNSEARTTGTREANLKVILRATSAAIPAALEASDAVYRTGWVPINRLIQRGQVIASTPELREFGMANLQLAEHWARAMNPTGVMRESDRDLALNFLDTADSPTTYRRVVAQLNKQIERELESVQGVAGHATPKPGAGAPAATPAPAAAASAERDKAIRWLNENPNHPQAAAIRKKLGLP